MKTLTGLLLISLACSVLFTFLYPTLLDARMTAKEEEADRLVQKFEQMELDALLKDESLYLEYHHFYTGKLVDTFFSLKGARLKSHTKGRDDWESRFESLNLRMSKILTKVDAVKRAERGDIDARMYLAAHKIDNMLALAIFRLKFDRFEQIQRDDLWDVSAFGEFCILYVDVKFKEDYIFFEFDSLHRLEQKEYDIYVDRIKRIARSAVEWAQGLELDELNPEEKKNFSETYKDFSRFFSI